MKFITRNSISSVVIGCALLFEAVDGKAITVKVDSTKSWLAWMDVLETNGAYHSGTPWGMADLPAEFIPSNSPNGWPLNTLLVLRPNTSTYNLADPFWNFPDGSPAKIPQAIFYVDVYTEFGGKAVTFQGFVSSNNIPGLTGGLTTGWQVVAFVTEFTSSYAYVGETTVPLRSGNSFSVSRSIGSGRVCQYGFFVRGPNTAPDSANALKGVGIRVEDSDPMITGGPYGNTINRGGSLSLEVAAIGSSALSYQWKHGGVALTNDGRISGASTASLTIDNAQLSDSGQYTVTVSDTAGSIISQPAQVTVLCVLASEAEPFFIQSMTARTNGAFTLAWESCSSQLYEVQSADALSVSNGWTPRTLMIGQDGVTSWTNTNAPATKQRFYSVKRFNFDGDSDGDGLSNLDEFNKKTDLHNPDTDGDQIPDGWEARYGLNPLSAADAHADSDGDGFSNLQEYQSRTRPNASYSRPATVPGGLVAWWKFDEGTGTNVFDSSLNGHHGYTRGGNPNAAWTAGYFSNGVTLGGLANNWIQVPYLSSLSLTQEFTLMGWVKPNTPGVLAGNFDSAGAGNYLVQFAPDAVKFQFSPAGDGTGTVLQFNPNWFTNDWHHLAACYSRGTNISVFVDGEWRASQSVTGAVNSAANPILIGFPGLTNAFALDDLRIYNRALMTNEIVSLTQGNGLPLNMIVGQTATLRAFGASESDVCQWSVVSGQGFFTNSAGCAIEFRPSWSGTATVQVVVEKLGVFQTNIASASVTFPQKSPLSDWNDGSLVQYHNNCYNFATDIRTDTVAQPGGPPFYYLYTCPDQLNAALVDGLQPNVNLNDLCHTSGLPEGHIVAMLVLPPSLDFHWVRMEADGTWSSKAGVNPATTLDNAGQPITDPRTANWQTLFGTYQFCGFFWVGPKVNILHNPQ